MTAGAQPLRTITSHRETARYTLECEIAALERLHGSLGESFERAATLLADLPGKVITLGVGKSGHAAQKVAATFRSVGLPAVYLNALDSMHGDLGMIDTGDVAMLFSKSGATSELLTLMPHLRSRGITTIAVVGTVGSPIGRECTIVLDTSVEREGCPLDVAPMASVLAAQAIGDGLAAAVTHARGFSAADFARLHPAGALGARLTLSVSDVMRQGDELPRIDQDAGLKDAVIEITRTGFGAVCVVDSEGLLCGFLTDGDIRRKLLETDDLGGVRADEIMTRNPLSIDPRLPLSQALLMLEQRKKAFLTAPVVVDGGRCVGLLRLHDAVQAHLKS